MKDFIIGDEVLRLVCVYKPNGGKFTIGNTYESKKIMKHIELDAFVVLVSDDMGIESWQGGSCFKPIDEIRDEKINQILK